MIIPDLNALLQDEGQFHEHDLTTQNKVKEPVDSIASSKLLCKHLAVMISTYMSQPGKRSHSTGLIRPQLLVLTLC